MNNLKIAAEAEGMRSEVDLSFIAQFRSIHGRPLRVLHIGNIANNGYNNACIQRQYGIEADVICYNYYHIMSCPEWEDGNLRGEIDHHFPDWWSSSLKGWRRPRWFAQGPALLCIDYLRTRNANQRWRAALKWWRLEAVVHNLSREMSDGSQPGKHQSLPVQFVNWVIAAPLPGENSIADCIDRFQRRYLLARDIRERRGGEATSVAERQSDQVLRRTTSGEIQVGQFSV